MDCQQQVEASNNIIAFPPVTIHVMVVDDDTTSLAVLSNLLKTLNYQVALFTDPIRALYTLRAGKQSFDLIVTASHMSKMDGIELTKRVNDEFKLPVIMISTDNRESVMYRAIQEGVVLYLVKPFSENDLTNIWQFAIHTKSRSEPNPSLTIEVTRSDGRVESQAFETHSVSASNEVISERKIKKSSKGNQEKANGKKEVNSTKKKPKVVWTDFLQYRFLQAVHFIGLDRAVPKKILEVMNVPNLTRENVASHLQKYRIFLRKVSERCMITPNKTAEEMLCAKLLSQHASFMLQKIQQKTNSNLISSQNPNSIPPFPIHQSSLNPNIGDRQSKPKPWSFEAYLSPYYGLGYPASSVMNFAGCPLPMMNQNYNAQAFNFPGAQFPNLDLSQDHSYLGCSSFSTNNGYNGFSVGIGGGLSMAQMGVPLSNGFDGNGQFGPYGIGFGGDHNSYNPGFMCNNNDVNFGGDSQTTVRHSSHALDNKQPISGGFMKDQSPQFNNNMSTADEVIPTTDPLSIDEQALNEFMASLLKDDGPAQG